jgi:hypothetical protein
MRLLHSVAFAPGARAAADLDGEHRMDEGESRSTAADGDGQPGGISADLRRIGHDINGALNTLALNIELLDRATAAADAAGESSGQAARERSLAALRRAVAEIQRIVLLRLAPLADSGPEGG